MDQQKEPLRIAFSTQKGGVGKSTFTSLMASLLHYRLGFNVAVLDCDFPQYSIQQMRERDLKAVMQNEAYKKLAHKQFTSIKKKAYPILQCKAADAPEVAAAYCSNAVIIPDILFFDLPGTVNTPGVLSTLAGMDHIFSPITADRMIVESTLSFTDVLLNVLGRDGQTSIKSIKLFWNQVDGREKSPLYHAYESVIRDLGLSLMQTFINDSKRFRKEGEAEAKSVFRSTLLPPDERLMAGCNLDRFTAEFLETIKFDSNGE